ncbi:hypothetical protein [Roseibacillus persicicus]|uniref:HNH nuclease domain-containing protein n=1 Tax=Roseibacillus persicicus TaxID=454148 RepID=A0A918TR53_9BACT|nr:hypothetical protein [Roseibacillus persicicus]GHC56119.1 hypothetical protein GCM10007100_23770 [Roseibacillus persicicus]
MLFTYTYVPHSLEGLQECIKHLVQEVWCKASGDFDIELLHPELKKIVLEIFHDDSVTKTKLFEPIKEIFDLFKTLDPEQKSQFQDWCETNNDIEALCKADPEKQPVTYSQITKLDSNLSRKLKAFFKMLYPDVLNLSAVRREFGSVSDHFQQFIETNDAERCPCCGIERLKNQYNKGKREAYDHFLPKAKYPFNTVNFHNLAPICHDCNSTYKGTKDPLKRRNSRQYRKSFYIYATNHPDLECSLTLRSNKISCLKPSEIDLNFSASGYETEIEAWDDTFNIRERYKAICCGKNDGKYWLQQVFDESQKCDASPKEIAKKVHENAKKYPEAEANFLKSPFLKACEEAGLFRPNSTTNPT